MLYQEPIYGKAYSFFVALGDAADANINKINPTLASGDVVIEHDGVLLSNITTLPSVLPAGGSSLLVPLSDAEMKAANVVVKFKDAAGAEWADLTINIQPGYSNVLASGIASGGTTTTLISADLTQADDYWNGQILRLLNSNGAAEEVLITDFVAATDTLTFIPAVAGAVANLDNFDIRIANAVDFVKYKGVAAADPITLDDMKGIDYVLSSTATGGTTTTLIDTVGLTQADDYWIGRTLRVTRAGNAPIEVTITDSILASNSLVFEPALPGAVAASDAYEIRAYGLAGVKAKTDKLTFTIGNEVDANMQSMNDAPMVGNGVSPKFGV